MRVAKADKLNFNIGSGIFRNQMLSLIFICLSLIWASPSFPQFAEWESMSTTRVMLREEPSAQSRRITTLDFWTKITIIGEQSGWNHVRLENGITGWVSDNFTIPRAAMDHFTAPSIIDTVYIETGSFGISPDTLRQELTSEPEPFSRYNLDDFSLRHPFLAANYDKLRLNIIIPMLMLVLIGSTLFMISKIRTAGSFKSADGKEGLPGNELSQLKKSNKELKKQINYAQKQHSKLEEEKLQFEKETKLQKDLDSKEYERLRNEFNKLEQIQKDSSGLLKEKEELNLKISNDKESLLKEIESLNKNNAKIKDDIQQQAVNHTLSEQNNKEAMLQKQNTIESLEAATAKMEKEFEDKEALNKNRIKEYEKEADDLRVNNNKLKEEIAESEAKLNSAIEKAAAEREELFKNQLKNATENLTKEYESKIELIRENELKETNNISVENVNLKEELNSLKNSLDEEHKIRLDLVKRLENAEKLLETAREAPVSTSDFDPEDYKKLKDKHDENLRLFETSTTKWESEIEQLNNTINELEEKIATLSELPVMTEEADYDAEQETEPEPKKTPVILLDEEMPGVPETIEIDEIEEPAEIASGEHDIIEKEEFPVEEMAEQKEETKEAAPAVDVPEEKVITEEEDYARSFFKKLRQL